VSSRGLWCANSNLVKKTRAIPRILSALSDGIVPDCYLREGNCLIRSVLGATAKKSKLFRAGTFHLVVKPTHPFRCGRVKIRPVYIGGPESWMSLKSPLHQNLIHLNPRTVFRASLPARVLPFILLTKRPLVITHTVPHVDTVLGRPEDSETPTFRARGCCLFVHMDALRGRSSYLPYPLS
jgi:hypothetical protein